MYTLTDAAAAGMSMLDFPAPAGKVISGAFDEAVETNPVPLFMMARELNAAKSTGPQLQWWEATDQAKRAGVKINIPDEGMTQAALSILIERRKDEAARGLLFARKEGAMTSLGVFGASLAGTLLDPVNAAAGFIPVLGGTKYAAALAGATTAGARAGVRLGVGAAEGLVGATAVELPTAGLRRELQDEYTLYDSLANIAFGTFASSGLRGVTGLARDRWRGVVAARQEDFLRSIAPGEWRAAREVYQAQLQRDVDFELTAGFERGGGPSEGLRARWGEERIAAEDAAQQRLATESLLAEVERSKGAARRSEIETFIQEQRLATGESAVRGAIISAERAIQAEAIPAFLRSAEDIIALRADKEGADLGPLIKQAIAIAKKPGFQRTAEDKLLLDAILNGQLRNYLYPRNDLEVASAISDPTHAQALKTAVAQAIEGRRIDVDPIVRQDPIFGPQRIGPDAVRERALANQLPENKVGADKQASVSADRAITTEGPAAKPGGAEPPPPRGLRPGEVAGLTAEMAEVKARLAEARAQVEAAAKEAGVEVPKLEAEATKKAEDYEKAWRAIADCLKGKGI